jgi:hypothetical protein
MKQLLHVVGGGDYCALLSRLENSSSNSSKPTATTELDIDVEKTSQTTAQFMVYLCNAIGAPIQTKFIDFEPTFAFMNSTHLFFASKSHIYIWNYQSTVEHSSLRRNTSEKYCVFAQDENSNNFKSCSNLAFFIHRIIFIDNPNAPVWYSDSGKPGSTLSSTLKSQVRQKFFSKFEVFLFLIFFFWKTL